MELEKEIQQKEFRNDAHKASVNIIYTFNWLTAQYADLFKTHGITSQQFNVLRILRGQHPQAVTIKTIRDRMLDKMSDASRIVEKLRLKGLLDRVIDEEDRRACKVTITRKGMDLLSEFSKFDPEFDRLFYHLNSDELKQLNHLLDKLRG